MLGVLGSEDTAHPFETSQALFQHYGAATHFVDLTSDPAIAAWFACHRYSSDERLWGGSSLRHYQRATYRRLSDGVGFVIVLAIRNAEDLLREGQLLDLRTLPSTTSRPHRQHGWLLYDRPPILPEPGQFWAATIGIERSDFDCDHAIENVFPPPDQDPLYRALLELPYVQVPGPLAEHDGSEPPASAALSTVCLGVRLIPLPEYYDHAEGHDHKWRDFTLYEPHPVRTWTTRHFHLEEHISGVQGCICSATKITVAPWALEEGRRMATIDRIEWPALESSDLYFSFAQIDHDKVIEHGPPYDGVWLHREEDLIVETQVTADDETLTMHAGHTYRMKGRGLTRQVVSGACQCSDPDSHDVRVATALALPELIRNGQLVLLPHPTEPNWHFVL
jgi:hypothetical protein